jgi:lysozyme
MSRTPGTDVSEYQGEINWRRVAAAGYRFAITRATLGNYDTDVRFYVNWDGAREAGLLVSAYHVVAPERPADSQIERLFDVLDGRSPDLPLVLDVELRRGISPEGITACVGKCADLVEEREGRKPMIYTAIWFWNYNVLEDPKWADYDLWVANYGVEVPSLPRGWDDWMIWQYSEEGQIPGIAGPALLDWFNGSYDELVDYAGGEPVVDEMPLAGLKARVAVEKLNLRSGPGMNYGDVGDLHEGDLVNVVTLSGEDIWIQVEPGKWAPFRWRGKRYMELE